MSTFNLFIQLAAATGRPVVFFDFETAGLLGEDKLPPVEIALVVFGSEETASDLLAQVKADLATPEVACGPLSSIGDLATFALSSRLNPGQPIRLGATEIHGIKDADVADAPRFDDPGFVGLMHSIDAMDPIWCGHNVKRFDLPLAERCGILPTRPTRLVLDTMRWTNGLATREAFPSCFDATLGASDPHRGQVVPVCEIGLDFMKHSLSALHAGLCGWRFEGAHGAMSDVLANVRVASRLFDLWLSDAFGHMSKAAAAGTLAINDALALLLAECDRTPAGMTGHDGWLKQIAWTEEHRGEVSTFVDYEIQKGKNRGRHLSESSVSDMRWIRDLPDIDDGTRSALDSFLAVATTEATFDAKPRRKVKG